MAGKIIADTIEASGSQISLNVGNVTILTASSTGLTLTPTSNVNINVANSTLAFGAGNVSFPSITTSGDTNTGLYFPTADTIGFVEGGAEVMRINSSGFVGIGTTTPQRKLSIVGTDGATGQTEGNSRASLFLDNNGANYLSIFTGTSGDGGVFFSDNGSNNGGMVYETSSDALYFKANNAERMRIDSSGSVSIGTASVAQTLSTNHYLSLRNTSGNPWGVGPTTSYGSFYVTNSGIGVYLANGGTSWTAQSDERTKTALVPFTNALDKVSTLRTGTGRYLTDAASVSRSFMIAQDVLEVLPEAVDVGEDEQGTLGLRYTEVIPLLTAAIQELKVIVDAQAVEIAALKAK